MGRRIPWTRRHDRGLAGIVAGVLAGASLLTGCSGDDEAGSGPLAGSLSFYTAQHFIADAGHVASPESGVLLALRDPALLGGRTGTALEQRGIDLIPYDFSRSGPRTYCWDGDALLAAAAGAPHRMVLRDSRGQAVLEVVEGGPCVTQTIPAGRYAAVFHHGTGRIGERDVLFVMPRRDAVEPVPSSSAPAPAALATNALTCPQKPYSSSDFGPGDVVVAHGGYGGMTVNGACGDIMLIQQPLPGDLDAIAILGAGPQTKVTLYAETGFRGKRWQIMPSGQFFDYSGVSHPQMRSFVPEVGTSDTNATRITTNGCKGCNLQAADLSGLDLKGVVLDDADLSRASLGQADLTGASAARALFASAHLAGAKLVGTVLTNAIFQSDGVIPQGNGATYPAADLSDADLSNARLDNAVMTGVTAPRATFLRVTIANVDFTGADLTDASFESATSPNASPPVFDHATMTRVSMKNAVLRNAFFRSAQMSPVNLGGADLSGAWMEADANDPTGRPTVLAGSYLYNTVLANARMSKAVLSGVSWFNTNPGVGQASGADAVLTGAKFDKANLPNLNLSRATLVGVSMVEAQLINTDLTGVEAGGAAPCGENDLVADLDTANLRGAVLVDANLSCADLHDASISTTAETSIYVEVLADPGRFTKPVSYQYLKVTRPATALGGDSAGDAVNTIGAICPNNVIGPCDSPAKWTPNDAPQEPTNCVPLTYDADGNVIKIQCTPPR